MARTVLDRTGRLPGRGDRAAAASSRPASATAAARAAAGEPRRGRATPPPSTRASRAALDAAARPSSRRSPRQTAARAGEEVGAIFEAQALFARDPGIVDPALAADRARARRADDAILAGHATSRPTSSPRSMTTTSGNGRPTSATSAGASPRILRGDARPDLWHADGPPAVLVAADLDPSAVATLRPELVAGIALAGGAPTGHAAIVARALGIPLVLGLGAGVDGASRRRRGVSTVRSMARTGGCSSSRRRDGSAPSWTR